MSETPLEFKDLQTTTDYQLMIDEVQSLMYADSDPDTVTLDRVQRNYAAAVKYVNGRLDECDELLRKGLRDECLQACRREPNLVDVAMLLDFPERAQWPVYLKQFEKAAPPELKTDVAAELNEAFAVADSLAELMNLHRVHALAHSPLRVRMDVMRKIARQDSLNPIWTEDLKTFEKARLHHVQAEFKEAVARDDFKTLSQLDKELNSDVWLAPPPTDLVKRVGEACSRLRVNHARSDLEQIAAELAAAYAENDLPRARAARSDWEGKSSTARLADNSPLVKAAQVPLEWLRKQELIEDEQRAYDAAVVDLELALDKGVSRLVLDRKAHAVARFDRGMPEQLEQRLATRNQQLLDAQRRRWRLKLAVTVASLLGVCGLGGYLISVSVRGAELRAHASNLQKLLDAKDYDVLAEHLSRIERDSPALFNKPEIQRIRDELQKELKKQNEHGQQFHERLKEARERLKNALESPPERPDFDAIEKGRKIAGELNEIAADERDFDLVKKLLDEVQQAQLELQKSVDAAFRDEFQKLRERSADNLEGLKELSEQGRLLSERLHVSAAEMKPLKDWLTTDVKPRMDKLELGAVETAALHRITAAVGNPAEFRKQLADYSGNPKFDKLRAADFKKLLEREAAIWDGMQAWNEFLEKWHSLNLVDLTNANWTVEFTAQANALRKSHGNLPYAKQAEEAVNCLDRARQRGPIAKTIMESIKKDVFTKPLVLSLKDKGVVKHYYTLKEPKKTGNENEWNIYKVLNSSTLQEDAKTRPVKGTLENGYLADGKIDWQSAQSKFSEAAQKRLDRINSDNWDEPMLDLISLLQNDGKIDPILKMILLESFFENACRGSIVLEKALAPQRTALLAIRNDKTIKFNPNANWIDPDNSDANELRTKIAKALEKRELRIPDSVKAEAQKRTLELRKFSFGDQYIWRGWLLKESDRKWTCSLKDTADNTPEADVVIFVPTADAKSVQLNRVGKLTGGRVQLDLAQENRFMEGRPVFVVRRK